MKLRLKKNPNILAWSGSFNTSSIGEIIVYFEDDADSDYISNYDVWLENKREWKDLGQAFKDHDVIVDNYNTKFFEPETEEDKVRGYAP